MTALDCVQAIDELVMSYNSGGVSAERAMTYIDSLIKEFETSDEG